MPWMQNNMILLKITNGQLETNWGEIEALAQAYDNGCRSEDSYRAKIMNLIFELGYISAMEDMEKDGEQIGFLMTHTMGNA